MLRVIYNPVAGPRMVRKINRIKETLSRMDVRFEIMETAAPGDATTLAREAAEAGAESVVAVGGDGTINEVANGLAGSRTRLAVVPHGTGNVFSKELALPAAAEGCLRLLWEGKTLTIPLARAGDRFFVLVASAGFDAEVVERMNSRQKNVLGIAAYYLAGLRHLLRPQPTLWLEFPSRERIEVQSVILCRGRKYGGGVVMAPAGNLTSRSFQVVALVRKGRLAIVRFALDAIEGRHLDSGDVLIRETGSVSVRCRIPSAAQVDGDYLGPLPVRFEITDTPLRIVVPKEFPSDPSVESG